jgi:hypothetical protein
MLDPSADEIRAWGNSVVELMIDYLSEVGGRKIYGDFSSRGFAIGSMTRFRTEAA